MSDGGDLESNRELVLKLLAGGRVNITLGDGEHSFIAAFQKQAGPSHRRDAWQAIWWLLSRGLAYIDVDPRGSNAWELILTPAGRAAHADQQTNPDNRAGYLRNVAESLPEDAEIAAIYIREALDAYSAGVYRASAVMVGVASEAVFLDVAGAFGGWLDGSSGTRFRDICAEPRRRIASIFEEFRKRLEHRKSDLPQDLSVRLDTFFLSISEMIREQRNESGHPTGVEVTRDDCFTLLQIFSRHARFAYRLRDHFLAVDADGESVTL